MFWSLIRDKGFYKPGGQRLLYSGYSLLADMILAKFCSNVNNITLKIFIEKKLKNGHFRTARNQVYFSPFAPIYGGSHEILPAYVGGCDS